jgi:hypothetical protein
MIATTAERVAGQTAADVNERIRRQTAASVAYFAEHRDQIDRRLAELDREWDIERALETGSSALTLTGLLLGVTRGRKWLLLPLAVQGFFMQHALQGWCPPLPLFRRLSIRTADEINQERYALKALRGDFDTACGAEGQERAQRVMESVQGRKGRERELPAP